jgi:aminomethyltransferase
VKKEFKMELKETPLTGEHKKLNAATGPFAGWNMPIHYGSILQEARHTRTSASIFDIFHMGEFFITEPAASSSLDKIITVPVTAMKTGSCKYGFLLTPGGTVVDDLIVYRLAENEWMIVVNASNAQRDAEIIFGGLSSGAVFEDRSAATAKIDLQGPKSLEVLKKIAGEGVKSLRYYTFGKFDLLGGKSIISRTGYTGELGFEIYINSEKAVELWNLLLENDAVKPAGLGARDVLRIEMGYPLYGNELTEETTPLEAGLGRVIDFNKQFIGREELLRRKASNSVRKLVGIVTGGRKTPRHYNKVVVKPIEDIPATIVRHSGAVEIMPASQIQSPDIVANGVEIGYVTSGVFSPHLSCGIALAYVDSGYEVDGLPVSITTGRDDLAGLVSAPPFLKNTSLKYKEE